MEYTPNFDGPVEDFTMGFEDVNNIGGGEGTEDFNILYNRPKYDNQFMTGATNIPKVPTKTSDIANDSDFVNQSTINNLIDIKTSTKADASTVNELNTRIISAEGDLESLGSRVTTAEGAVQELKSRADIVDEELEDIRKDFDELSNKPNFVIMLNTYAELQNFDTELLKDTDTVGVLTDETHDNKTTFYNYRTFQNTWHYVGAIENDYTLPTASASEKGGVKVGSGLEISEDGTLSTTGGGGGEYTLPPATTDTLGGVKVGSGLTVTQDGVLSATGGGGGGGTSSGAKVLTTADYNFNSTNGTTEGTLDSVALWLLPSNIYTLGDGVKTFVCLGRETTNGEYGNLFMVFRAKEPAYGTYIFRNSDAGNLYATFVPQSGLVLSNVFDNRFYETRYNNPIPDISSRLTSLEARVAALEG